MTHPTHDILLDGSQLGDLLVGDTESFGLPQQCWCELVGVANLVRHVEHEHELIDEPRVDLGGVEHLLDAGPSAQGLHHCLQPAVVRAHEQR